MAWLWLRVLGLGAGGTHQLGLGLGNPPGKAAWPANSAELAPLPDLLSLLSVLRRAPAPDCGVTFCGVPS